MKTLYVLEQGAYLKKTNKSILIKKGKQLIDRVLCFELERLIIFGNVQLSTQLIDFLLDKNIDTVFLSKFGTFRGKLVGEESKNIFLRKKQFEKYDDNNFKLNIAKKIIEGKLKNYRTILMRSSRKYNFDAAPILAQIRILFNKLKTAERVDEVMGYEGKGSALYFNQFNNLIRGTFEFKTRIKRPPPDPVNVLLSFTYTLLFSYVQSAVYLVGLDPFLGNLHALEYSRSSLALDLMEELRPVIADAVVLNLINKNIIQRQDFEEKTQGIYKCFLKKTGRKKIIKEFERKLNSIVLYPEFNVHLTYRKIIEYQARQYARVIMGKEKEYLPFLIK